MSEKLQKLFTPKEIQDIAEKKAGGPVKVNNYVIKPLSEHSKGFMGEHLIITINVNNNEEYKFFVKKMPDMPEHRKQAEEQGAFYKEIELFKTLLEDINDAQNKLKTKWRPAYYFSQGHDTIVLEDLSLKEYKSYPERQYLDKAHTKSVLKALAQLHASTFIFENKLNKGEVKTRSKELKVGKEVEVCDIYPNLVFETEQSEKEGHPGHTYCEVGFKSCLVLIHYLEGYTEEERKIIKEKLPGLMSEIYQTCKPSKKYKNVLLHGDLWSNNMLFHYNDQGEVDHTILIDFQMARYGPPASDLMLFLHLTLPYDFRQKEKGGLLKYYYEEFSKELATYNIASSDVLPWDTLKESCDEYYKHGCLMCFFYFQVTILPPHLVDLFLSSAETFHRLNFVNREDLLRDSFLSSEDNKRRLSEAMNEIIKNFILKK